MGTVFCNSYLNDLSSKKNIGKISGNAWGLGFVGGLLALLVSFLLFDVNNSSEVKQVNLFVAAWFLIFSLPTFFFLKDSKRQKINKENISSSFNSILQTFKEISKYKIIVRFLIARLFYNDGLITIFALGGIYAIGTLNFTMQEVLILGIVLNVFAALGSFVFGLIEDRIGVRKVINLSLVILVISTFLAFISPWTIYPKIFFWTSGVLLGTMVGPNQSCSRSYMAQIIPEDKKNEFFGFYAFTGKATSFLGPLMFGFLTKIYSQQIGLLSVLVFFIIGLIIFNKREH